MGEGQLDTETARAEAYLIKDTLAPQVENGLKHKLPKTTSQLGGTAHMEMGSQVLKQVKKDNPDLYHALIARGKSFNTLVETIMPDYLDLPGSGYTSPGNRKELAAAASEEQRAKAYEKAEDRANFCVSEVVRAIGKEGDIDRKVKPGIATFKKATDAIAGIMERSHDALGEANPTKLASLLECALATDKVERHSAGFSLKPDYDINTVFQKQQNFDHHTPGVI